MLVPANIFQPVIDVFDAVIQFFHNSVGFGWGGSIIALTVCVRAVMIPLTFKQFHSMQRMQKLAPKIKELQQKYKDDKQLQQQKMMELYRENQVNPFASCLPLVLQLPVFISLFYMLRKDLKRDICGPMIDTYLRNPAGIKAHATFTGTTCSGAHNVAVTQHANGLNTALAHFANVPQTWKFLFIPDLTAKATGAVFIVLIIMYIASQLGSSVLMASATTDRSQRYMMMALPFVFVLFIARFPAGLLVYWITTNVWTIGQQYLVKRSVAGAPEVVATATAGANGSSPPTPAAKTPAKAKTPAGVAAGPARSAPRPPPRKKKKRSGRRR